MNTEAKPVEVVAEIPAELATVVQSSGLAAESAHTLESKFAPLFAEAKALIVQAQGITVTDASQVVQMKMARAARLGLRDVRIRAEKERKALKEDSLRRGKAIDGVYNVLAYLVQPVEEKLKAAEEFAERIEAERKAKLKAEREEALRPFGIDVAFYRVDEMNEAQWSQLFDSVVAADKAKKEAAAKAEAERIASEKAEAEERERVRLENERLKREAFEREQAAQAEREKLAAEKREAEEKARIEREKIEAEMRKQREEADRKANEAAAAARAEREAAEAKARAEQEAIRKQAQAEREAREKAEAEAKALRDAEAARIAAEEAARKKAARAPDREKVRAFAATVRSLPIPQASTTEGAAVVAEIAAQIEKFAAWLEKKGGEL